MRIEVAVLVLGFALVAASLPPVLADEGSSDSGSGSGSVDDSGSGRPGASGGSGSSGSGNEGDEGDGEGQGHASGAGASGDAGDGVADVAQAQREEREAFEEEQREEREAFEEEQREEREAFEEELRQREAECRALHETEAQRDCFEDLAKRRRDFFRGQAEEQRAFAREQAGEEREFAAEQHEDFRDAIEALRERPVEQRLGHFNVTNATVQGRFVSFTLDSAACAIRAVAIQGVPVLDEVRIEGAGAGDELKVKDARPGAVFKMACGEAGEVKVHDNPAAVLKAEADDGGSVSVRWDLADAVQVNVTRGPGDEDEEDTEDQDKTFLRLTAGNFNALLRLETASSLGDNHTWRAEEGQLVARGPNVLVPGAANRHRPEIDVAKEKGKVGAEVTVVEAMSGPVTEVVVLEDMALEVTPEEGRVRVVVNATGVGGKTIVVNVGQGLGLFESGRVTVRFFDEANGTFAEVPIEKAQDGLRDVLDPTNDAGPEWWAVHGDDGVQVFVSIPHFSTKAFEIQSVLPIVAAVPPNVLAGAALGVVFVALAGAGLVRRRR